MFASKNVFLGKGAATGAYTIGRSVRFRQSASAYMNRTFAAAGNQQKFTYSIWTKRGLSNGALAGSGWSGSGATQGGGEFNFISDQLNFDQQTNNGYDWRLLTTQVFRDSSSWYHIVVAVDTTQATAANRVLIYVNGVQVTSFSSATYPTQNSNTKFNATNQRIGAIDNGGSAYTFYDGYMAEFNFIDGQALTPSSFGAIGTNGVWQPARYTGTYGTNGFYLKFDSYATAAALGTDSSGNSNTWTVNNINVTAYSGSPPNNTSYDAMTDVPTLTSATAANYANWNPITQPYTNITRTTVDGNLNSTLASSGSGGAGTFSTIGMTTGSWYAEFTVLQIAVGTNLDIGILRQDQLGSIANGTYGAIGYSPYGYSVYQPSGAYANNNASSTSGTSYTTNDIVQVAFNASTGKLWFGKNGTFMSSGDPAAGTNPAFSSIPSNTYVFAFGLAAGVTGRTVQVVANFGQRPFSYTAPTGFVALNTYNLATPTIANGAAYMAATTYTGTGSSLTVANTVNGVSFQPDFVWIKGRSGATDNALYDIVRGTTKDLVSNSSAAETTQATGLTAFGSTGFTVGALAKLNTNTATYIGWQWLANGTGVTNTSGSITSTVSAGATQGFSVVTYTGTGANATVGHGLGVAPSMVIIKNRVDGGRDWQVYHVSLTSAAYAIQLGSTAGQGINATQFNSTAPTSSVFSIGTAIATNGSTNTFVAYCFAPVAGYSAFGSYAGNSSTDGPFIYLGFKPRWIMIKNLTTTGNWTIIDTSRQNYNVEGPYLAPNLVDAETTGTTVFDLLSNGFKCRSATTANSSGSTYLYACFAENPFNYALAR